MIYLPDTNAVSDLLRLHPQVTAQRDQRLRHGDQTNLCPPVLYEILRSLLKVNATAQIKQFQEQFIPNYGWTPVTDEDWRQTARFWADSSSKGKQLSNIDLLIAALAHRLNAVSSAATPISMRCPSNAKIGGRRPVTPSAPTSRYAARPAGAARS